jgi:hypothetical protein
VNIDCAKAFISPTTNTLALVFENDALARKTEMILKQQDIKTKHNESEITILNISDYEMVLG